MLCPRGIERPRGARCCARTRVGFTIFGPFWPWAWPRWLGALGTLEKCDFSRQTYLFAPVPSAPRPNPVPDTAPMGGILRVQAQWPNAHGARTINFFPANPSVLQGGLKFLLIWDRGGGTRWRELRDEKAHLRALEPASHMRRNFNHPRGNPGKN